MRPLWLIVTVKEAPVCSSTKLEFNSCQGSDIRKNGHFGGEHDGGYESGFITICLLHNLSQLLIHNNSIGKNVSFTFYSIGNSSN